MIGLVWIGDWIDDWIDDGWIDDWFDDWIDDWIDDWYLSLRERLESVVLIIRASVVIGLTLVACDTPKRHRLHRSYYRAAYVSVSSSPS